MTKIEIVSYVYDRLPQGEFTQREVKDLVDDVFDIMKEILESGEGLKISGFGNFVLRDKRQRQGRNPQTGDPIVITERRVLNFKASQLLKLSLNEEHEAAAAAADAGHGAAPAVAGATDDSGVGAGSSVRE